MIKRNKKKNEESTNSNFKIIMGDNSKLDISKVGDCLNKLRPQSNSKSQKIIPKNKK